MSFAKTTILLALIVIIVTACTLSPQAAANTPFAEREPSPQETPLAPMQAAAATQSPLPTAASTLTAVPTLSPTPTQTAEATPTATPHLLFPYTIPGLRTQEFPGGAVQILRTVQQDEAFTYHYIGYPSGDLTITGTMHVPKGAGPFPVLILLHGYFEREQYYPGADTWQAAEYFVHQGYLVLAPDYRSWGESDPGLSLFHTGLVADVMHLLNSLPSIPEADPTRIGLWGHSMGGGIATKILTIDDRVGAAVLYAPNSADDADLIARWGPGCLPGQSEAAGEHCNPGEFIPEDTPPDLVQTYLAAVEDPIFLRDAAPIHYLDSIRAPIQIHIGTADGSRREYTPPDWAAKLDQALQDAGKEVTFYAYPEQGHYFTGESWTDLLERSVTLFDENLKSSQE